MAARSFCIVKSGQPPVFCSRFLKYRIHRAGSEVCAKVYMTNEMKRIHFKGISI